MSTYCVLVRGGAFRRTASIGLLLAALTSGAQIASAQQQQQQLKTDEEIVVTGSRVRQTGFDSPQPLSVIDASTIQDLGIVNTGDVLRQMPQNTAFFTETNVGIGNFNVGSQLANLRGLNPFFGTRTLTLIDTRRAVPTSEGGAIDLTLIPSMLIGRTEVVTGGASAAYGSDAIAGVVNVILDTKLDGFKAQSDYGETTNGDGGDTHGAVAFGSGFAKTTATLSSGRIREPRRHRPVPQIPATGAKSRGQSAPTGLQHAGGVGNGRRTSSWRQRKVSGVWLGSDDRLRRRRAAIQLRRQRRAAVQPRTVPGVRFFAHRRRRYAVGLQHARPSVPRSSGTRRSATWTSTSPTP